MTTNTTEPRPTSLRASSDQGSVLRAMALVVALVVALLTTTTAAAQTESAPPSVRPDDPGGEPRLAPDIIMVVLDDFAYIEDQRVLERLPETNRLWLEGGLRFEQSHDQTPLCGPSRASLLTGKNTLDHNVTKNVPQPLDDSETIAVALQDAGYHTLLAGKYLNAYDGSVVPPGWDRAFMLDSLQELSFWRDGQSESFEGRFHDDVIRQEATRLVRRAPDDQPLFAFVSTIAPHVCRQDTQCYQPDVMPRDRGAEACAEIPAYQPPTYRAKTNPREVRSMPPWPRGWRLRQTCESLLVVDRTVAQLEKAQAERGRPAYFFFVADNGMSWGQKGFSLKHSPPSTRAPLYIAGPGIEPGSTDVLTSKIDVGPTIAELAGAELPWSPGTSMAPVLRGEVFEGPSELLEVMPQSSRQSYEGWNALRTASHRFIRWDDGKRELYDLAADPWEQRNLVKSESEVAATMEARLDELLVESAQPVIPAPSASAAPEDS
jgi:N-acetylglucosamine-6-sulfatase